MQLETLYNTYYKELENIPSSAPVPERKESFMAMPVLTAEEDESAYDDEISDVDINESEASQDSGMVEFGTSLTVQGILEFLHRRNSYCCRRLSSKRWT